MSNYISKQSRTGHVHEAATAAASSPGKRTLVEQAYSSAATVQRQAVASSDTAVHEAAARGKATPASALPHLDLIQRSFGRHDVSSIHAHTGDEAAGSAHAMGAKAYATGNDVVLGHGADLFTEAHEAAHVVQQRSGIQIKGGVGEEGDPYEQHADEVASLVVQGKSAEGLLNQVAEPRGAAGGGVEGQIQRQPGGEAWPGGPTVKSKSTMHTLAEYVGWMRQVEAKYGAKRDETLQRLRRLYYSKHVGGAGKLFDEVIRDAYGAGGRPMTTSDLPLEVINGLFETNQIVTPNGSLVDVSHIFAGLDLRVQGGNLKPQAGQARFGVDLEGVVSWVGDLASWFVEAKNEVKQRERQLAPRLGASEQVAILNGLAASKAAKDDLLGDVDAQVMADQFTTTTTFPQASPIPLPPPRVTTQDIPLSEMLSRYYGGEQATPGATSTSNAILAGPTSSNRFHYFVAAASPRIPHTRVSTWPLRVSLESNAITQIRRYVHNTARLFIDRAVYHSEPGDLKTYEFLLNEVVLNFMTFLSVGLALGDAPWP